MKTLLLILFLALLLFMSCEVLDKATPIPPEKASFIGLWTSSSGFRIDIKSTGTADITQIADIANPDYEKLNIKVAPPIIQDIRVKFREDNTLEVAKPTLYAKEYHIDSYPYRDSLNSKMVLNGVTFVKSS
jgi:hypothetical protein